MFAILDPITSCYLQLASAIFMLQYCMNQYERTCKKKVSTWFLFQTNNANNGHCLGSGPLVRQIAQ